MKKFIDAITKRICGGKNDRDAAELRLYLEQTCGGLRQDRSATSYALEFLKTERANLLTLQRKYSDLLAERAK